MKIIVPNYLKNFKCDGTLCDSYCCREWKITIDEETKNKYETLPIEIRDKIFLNIGEKEGNFYPLKLSKENRCPFLRKDCLCDLQKNFGEDFLSNICYSYPRVATKLRDAVFQCLTLSCPLAAKLVLFADEIFFEEKELENFRDFRIGWHTDITSRIKDDSELVEDMISAGLFILRDFSVGIDDRLKMLLNFYKTADEVVDNKNGLKSLLSSVENYDFQNKYMSKNFKNDEDIIFKKDKFLPIIIQLYNALYEADFNKEKIEELNKIYNENFAGFDDDFIKANAQIFTNFLVNEFFMRLYPYAFSKSFFVNIKVFILSWYALKFALFMMYMEKGLDEARLFFTVRRLVERMDHGKGVMRKIIDIAKEF